MRCSNFSLRRTKKHKNILDLLLIMLVLIVLSVISLVTINVLDKFNHNFQSNPTLLTAEQKVTMNTMNDKWPHSFDIAFLLAFIGAYIMLLISAFLIDTNPLFFIGGLGMFILVLCFAPVIANLFANFYFNESLTEYASQMPIMENFYKHLVLIMTICGTLLLIVLYGKMR